MRDGSISHTKKDKRIKFDNIIVSVMYRVKKGATRLYIDELPSWCRSVLIDCINANLREAKNDSRKL